MKPSEITYKSVQSKIDQNQVQTKNPRKWTYIGTYGRRLRIKLNINPVVTLKYAPYDLWLTILTKPDLFMSQDRSKSHQIWHLNFSVFVIQRFLILVLPLFHIILSFLDWPMAILNPFLSI